MKHGIKKQKTTAGNTGDKSSVTPREIEKEKEICPEFNHSRNPKFSEIGIRNYWRRNGFKKRVLKKNNLIRPGNRKTRMLFCQEKRNWTKEDWKKLFSSDETTVVIKNACKMQIVVKSDKNMFHIWFVVKIKSKSQSCSGDAFHRGV